MRFDFHWSSDGWRISEMNNDVPGGFSEASSFSALMAEHYANAPAGSATTAWTDAVAQNVGNGAVALLCAPSYLKDQQIIRYLNRELRARGLAPILATPSQIR